MINYFHAIFTCLKFGPEMQCRLSQPLSYPGVSTVSVQFPVHRHSFRKRKHHSTHLLAELPQSSE